MTYNVITADRSRHAVTLTSDRLTLKFGSTSSVTCWNSAPLTFIQKAQGLQDAARSLPELYVVEHAVGEVFASHVGVGASDEQTQRRIEVEFVGGRVVVDVDQFTAEVQHQTIHRVP